MTDTEPDYLPRVKSELLRLTSGGVIKAGLVKSGGAYYVIYFDVPTAGGQKGLPTTTDVLVPVPSTYAGQAIDMPALPSDSALLTHVVGGGNPQGLINADGRDWRLLSHHPYGNGGGPPWNALKHGFHDYYNHVYTWLHRLV